MWKVSDFFLVSVPLEDVPFVVPVEAWSARVGPDYVKQLAALSRGDYSRDPVNIGLLDDFGILRGRWLDPDRVHPLIREFYEHTSRFQLSIRPRWDWRFLPFFWLFRKVFAERVNQANLPLDIHEAQQGIASHIDCIDINHDKVMDLRGWIRTYAGTNRVVYVGIYTTIRLKNLGYVSVRFPFPNASFTATLIPSNRGVHDFVLRTHRTRASFAGDYIIVVNRATGRLDVLRIRGFREEIYVYVRNAQLFTRHSFFFLGANFVSLFYKIDRKPDTAR